MNIDRRLAIGLLELRTRCCWCSVVINSVVDVIMLSFPVVYAYVCVYGWMDGWMHTTCGRTIYTYVCMCVCSIAIRCQKIFLLVLV